MHVIDQDGVTEHDLQVGEVICGYLKAVECGAAPNQQELLARHAGIASELREFFADRDRMERLAAPLRDAVAIAAPATVAGTLVGSYEILEEIGRGGMGAVFAAQQNRPRRVVALKMILAGPWAGRQRLERFLSESEILARLRHPNIILVHEVGTHEGRPFFTMDYAQGGNLARKLTIAPLTAREAAELIQILAGAVHVAHEHGIVHRDLKPSNVLLAADGTPMIGDFGLAKQMAAGDGTAENSVTETGAVLGTPSYMAPEQASGIREVGPAADVYALGSILYESLTGRPPFKAATLAETLDQVRVQDPVPPSRLQPGLPRDLQTICLKCLAKEPRLRYATARTLADDLARFLAGQPIVARPVRAWERAWKWARRQPTAAALMAVSVLSVLALTAGVLIHDAQLRDTVAQAKSNEAEAHRQQQRAKDYYRESRDTLDGMLQQFDAYRVGEVPQLRELQRRQLDKALVFYQSILKGQDDLDLDAEVRYDTAFAHVRAADIQALLGQHAVARGNYDHAIDLLEALPPKDRARPRNQFLLANGYNRRGLWANNARHWDDAERDHLKARDIVQALNTAVPDNLTYRTSLAEIEHNLGALYQLIDKKAEAEHHYRQAETAYAVLRAAQPAVDAHQSRQADNLINLALLYQNTNRLKEAMRACESAEQLLRGLMEQQPAAGEYALSLAGLYGNWSFLLQATGQGQTALAKLNRGVDISEAVLKQEPNFAMAKVRVYTLHGARAQAYEAQGRWADAVPDWDRVVELEMRPNPWLHRVLRALALARAGMHTRAAAEAETLGKDAQVSPDGVYGVACVWALARHGVPMDQSLEVAQRTVLADRYAERAIALLRRLKAQGYFQDAAHARTLATDDDLRSLRDRADFQELLAATEESKR